MNFADFLINEAPMPGMPAMPPPGGGSGAPGGGPGGLPAPGAPPGGGLGMPPPPSGPLGGMAGGGMGGGMGMQQPQTPPMEIKTKDVWSLLEKLLSSESPADSKNSEDDFKSSSSKSYIGLRT